jgi:hypothetical protein
MPLQRPHGMYAYALMQSEALGGQSDPLTHTRGPQAAEPHAGVLAPQHCDGAGQEAGPSHAATTGGGLGLRHRSAEATQDVVSVDVLTQHSSPIAHVPAAPHATPRVTPPEPSAPLEPPEHRPSTHACVPGQVC